jgi:copper transport protein
MTPSASGRAGRRLSLLFLALVALMLPASPARAHALIGSSDPPDGVRLEEPPEAVTITFTEPPDPALSFIHVHGQGGMAVHRGSAESVPDRPQALTVPLAELEEGVYTVTWRAVSRVDGHATAGFLSFGVGVSPLDAPGTPRGASVTPRVSAMEMAGRWALFIGLGLLLGTAWVGAAAFREAPGGVLRLMLAGLAVGAVGLAGLAVAQQRAAGVGFGALLGTSVGRALLLRAAALAAAGAAAGVAMLSPRWRRWALGAAAIAAAMAMLAHSAAGHAASGSFLWAKVTSQWAHFAAAGVWLGGLAALIVGVRGRPTEWKARAVRRFSFVAGIALGVVVVTGALRAFNEVGTWGALFSTSYGQVVLVKSGLLAALVGLGAINRYRNVPAAGRSLRGLRAVSGAELSIAGVVLVASAALASLVPPALIPPPTARAAALVVTGSDFATSVQARLDVEPGVPGPNSFLLRLTDYDTAEPLDAERVALRFSFPGTEVGESTLELLPAEQGLYRSSGANLALAGPWSVTVLVQRGVDSVEIPLTVGTICRTKDIPARRQPTIHILELPNGVSVEGLVFPEEPGETDVHFTFTDDTGEEVLLRDDPLIVGSPPDGDPFPLRAERLDAGHFTARTEVGPGTWRFDIATEAKADGRRLSGCFEATIPA